MDIFKKIRKKYPLIKENGNMFKLLIMLRSVNSNNFRKISMYNFLNIAEYLFFDEYMAEKLYLVKLQTLDKSYILRGKGFLIKHMTVGYLLSIKKALLVPIEKFPYVTVVGHNGKVNYLELPPKFKYINLPDQKNYIDAFITIKENVYRDYLYKLERERNVFERQRYFGNLFRIWYSKYIQKNITYIQKNITLKIEKSDFINIEKCLGIKKEEKRGVFHYNKRNKFKNHNLIVKGRYRKKINRKW